MAGRLCDREISALEVVEACLARIEQREAVIHAWQTIDAERARERARDLDRGPIRGRLHGLPIGVKDIVDTVELPTEYGSSIYAGHRPAADATCVAAAMRAGAIVLGKTVTTEFATFKPTRTANPRNVAHTPGGSSSGSAAAVADGMVPGAFGTQTLGSVIRPAGYCGIVGFKPSFGLIAREGVKLIAPSLDTVGVFASTVTGAGLLVGAITGRDDLSRLPAVDRPLRIGVCRGYADAAVSDAMLAALESAGRRLARAGAEVREIELPADLSGAHTTNETIYRYELARSLAHERRRHGDELSGPLREAIDAGRRISERRYHDGLAATRTYRETFRAVMNAHDVLLTPSTTGEAPEGLTSTGSPIMNQLWTLLHASAINVPVATGPKGLPLGLQVIGGCGDDASTLAAADRIHALLRMPAE